MASLGHAKSLAAMLLAGTALAVYGCGTATAAEASPAPIPAQAFGINVNGVGAAPPAGSPHIIVPPSDAQAPGVAHTNVKLLATPAGAVPPVPGVFPVPPQAANLVETPASVACSYHMAPGFQQGCSPISANVTAQGGSKGIAIVTAFHNPNALSDLRIFSSYFYLPEPAFVYVSAPSSGGVGGCNNAAVPPSGVGTGWDLEGAMAVETVHAMAPGARVWLIEAQSASIADLMSAVDTATACLKQYDNGGQIVMPWSVPEFPTETSLDSHFNNTNVAYLSAAGDAPGVSYPAASPYVVGIGGTTFSRNQSNGNFKTEAVWNDAFYGTGTGGGPSAYETLPGFQNFAPLNQLLGAKRGTPDLSALADPVNGFWIYNTTYQNGWAPVGGTGLATSLMGGYFNWANFFWASSAKVMQNIYGLGQSGGIVGYTTNVNSGLCGPGGPLGGLGQGYNPLWIEAKYSGLTWDWCTGWGTPKGNY
jgi:kumamolisin